MYNNVLRLSPAMNITKTYVDEALRLLDASFAAVSQSVMAGA
jgi:acetylornithine/succinyldiaminopimelate/putrescine aminotransferase